MDTTDLFADWSDKLSHVEGTLIGREQRVSVADLLAHLDAAHLAGAARCKALSDLKTTMVSLGWQPAVMRIGGGKTMRGYVRRLAEPASEPTTESEHVIDQPKLLRPTETEDAALARQLERVCGMGLTKLEEVLSLPLLRDGHPDGNVLRAATAAAGTVIQAQVRVDETRLKVTQRGDVLDRLLKIIRAERRAGKISKAIPQIAPDTQQAAEAYVGDNEAMEGM
jgi:hypothetical protein